MRLNNWWKGVWTGTADLPLTEVLWCQLHIKARLVLIHVANSDRLSHNVLFLFFRHQDQTHDWNKCAGNIAGCPFQVLVLVTRRFAGSHQIRSFCIPHVSGPIGFCNGYDHQIFEIPVVPGRGSFRGENTKKLKEDFAYRTHARRPGSGMPKANCCVVHQPSDVPSDGGVLLVVAGLYSM